MAPVEGDAELDVKVLSAVAQLHGLLQRGEARLLGRVVEQRQLLDSRLSNVALTLKDNLAVVEEAMKETQAAVTTQNVPLVAVKQKLDAACVVPCHVLRTATGPDTTSFRLTIPRTMLEEVERLFDRPVPQAPEIFLVSEEQLPPSHIPSAIEVNPDPILDALEVEISFRSDADTAGRAGPSLSANMSRSSSQLSITSSGLSSASSAASVRPRRRSTESKSSACSVYKTPDMLGEGDQEDVIVTHFIDPQNFYVQYICNYDHLSKLTKAYGQHAALSPPVTEIHRDYIYLAQYSHDNNWYRARILSCVEQDSNNHSSYEVFFLDYGNTDIVSIQQLRKILPRHAIAPPEALKCSFFDLVPTTGVWSKSSVVTMSEIVNDAPLRMYVIRVDGDRFLVDLSPKTCHFETDVHTSLRDTLLFLGEGTFMEPESGLWHNSTIPAFKKLRNESLSLGGNYNVCISFVNSPSDFYLNLLDKEESTLKLMESLNEHYSTSSVKGSHIYLPFKGMYCAAKFSIDNCWYRATVFDIPESKKVEVQYIDFGNKEVLLWSELRVLRKQFLALPAQAIHCSLADISPLSGNRWAEEANELLKSLDGSKLQIHVEDQKDNTFSVLLYNCGKGWDISVNALLSQKGLARSTGCNSVIVEYLKDETDLQKVKEDQVAKLEDKVYQQQVKKDKIGYETYFQKANKNQIVESKNVSDLQKVKEDQKNSGLEIQTDRMPNKTSKSSVNPLISQKKGNNSQKKVGVSVQDRLDAIRTQKMTPPDEKQPLKISIKVLEAESPGCLYVMLCSQQKHIESLMKDMHTFYEKDVSDDVDVWKPRVKQRCAAKSARDHRWHRAIILEELPDNNFKVLLKDYAQKEIVPLSKLRVLAQEFLLVRDGTIKCHLANIKPAGAPTAGGKAVWSSYACEELKRKVSEYSDLFITKRGQVDLENRSLPVELWVCNATTSPLGPCKEDWFTLNRALVDQGVALPVRSDPTDEEDMFMTSEDFSLLSPKPDAITLEWLTKTNQDDDSSSIDTDVFSDFDEDDDMPNPSEDWLSAPVLDEHEFLGIVTYVDHQCFVYIQDIVKTPDTLKRLTRAMNTKFKNSKPKPHDSYWFAGQICVAQYHLDNNWYRGKVVKVLEDHTIDVLFVDYGNVENCKASELRKNVYLKSIPVQARKCRLHGLTPVAEDGKWPVHVLDFIHSILVERDCKIRVLQWPSNDDDCYEVELKTTNGAPLKDVLIEMNYASYNPPSIKLIIVPEETCDIHDDSSDVIIEEEVESVQRNSDPDLFVLSASKIVLQEDQDCLPHSDDVTQESNSSETDHITLVAPNNSLSTSIPIASPHLLGSLRSEVHDRGTPPRPSSDSRCDTLEDKLKVARSKDTLEVKSTTPKIESSLKETRVKVHDFLLSALRANREQKKFKLLPLPLSDSWVVNVVSVLSPSEVVIQIVAVPSVPEWKLRSQFLDLMKQMQEMVQHQDTINEVFPGMCCCALSNGIWYRASVVEVLKDKVEVLLVDGHCFGTVPIDMLRKIPDEWISFPIQALSCYVNNFSVDTDFIETMREELFCHEWDCTVVNRSPLCVELHRIENSS